MSTPPCSICPRIALTQSPCLHPRPQFLREDPFLLPPTAPSTTPQIVQTLFLFSKVHRSRFQRRREAPAVYLLCPSFSPPRRLKKQPQSIRLRLARPLALSKHSAAALSILSSQPILNYSNVGPRSSPLNLLLDLLYLNHPPFDSPLHRHPPLRVPHRPPNHPPP